MTYHKPSERMRWKWFWSVHEHDVELDQGMNALYMEMLETLYMDKFISNK